MASYLDARQRLGRWYLRIDDIDPPREAAGAAESIQRDLEHMGLHWDGPTLFQSSRFADYLDAVEQLLRRGWAYHCACSRRDLRDALASPGSGPYAGTCRHAGISAHTQAAIRVTVESKPIAFVDRVQGPQSQRPDEVTGDFVIYRRDQLPAYHLATVLDEAQSGITDVVRGIDLLDTTPSQIYLQGLLGLHSPRYAHVPVVVNGSGQKLSKQTGALRAMTSRPGMLAWNLLRRLGLRPPSDARDATPGELWAWAIPHWRIEALAGQRTISE